MAKFDPNAPPFYELRAGGGPVTGTMRQLAESAERAKKRERRLSKPNAVLGNMRVRRSGGDGKSYAELRALGLCTVPLCGEPADGARCAPHAEQLYAARAQKRNVARGYFVDGAEAPREALVQELVVRIEIPRPTPSQNELTRWHFRKSMQVRDDLCFLIRQRMLLADVTPAWARRAPGDPRRRADGSNPERRRLVVHRHSVGRLDRGNLVGGCKLLVDALVLEGLIFDDDEPWLEDRYLQLEAKRGEGRTEVEIWR